MFSGFPLGCRKPIRNLDVYSEQRLSSRLNYGRTTSKQREIVKEPSLRTDSEQTPDRPDQGDSKTQELVSETEPVDDADGADRTEQSSLERKDAEEIAEDIDEDPCSQDHASPSAGDPTQTSPGPRDEHVVNDLVDLSDEPKPCGTTEASSGTSSSSSNENEQECTTDVSCLIQKAKNVVFDLIDDEETFPVSNCGDIVEESRRYRQEWLQLNETLKVQDLDLVGDEEIPYFIVVSWCHQEAHKSV